jgi:hypothetical protein
MEFKILLLTYALIDTMLLIAYEIYRHGTLSRKPEFGKRDKHKMSEANPK